MLKVGNNIIKLGGNWLNAIPGGGPEPEPPTPSDAYYLFEGYDPYGATWTSGGVDYTNSFGVFNFKINGSTPSINGANPTLIETDGTGTLENAIGSNYRYILSLNYGDDELTPQYIKFKADSVSSVSFNMGAWGQPAVHYNDVKTRIYKVVDGVKTLIGEYTGSGGSTITINCTDV